MTPTRLSRMFGSHRSATTLTRPAQPASSARPAQPASPVSRARPARPARSARPAGFSLRTRRAATAVAAVGTITIFALPTGSSAALRDQTVPRSTPNAQGELLAWYDTTAKALQAAKWGDTGSTQIFATRTWVAAFGAAEDAIQDPELVEPGKGISTTDARRVAVANAVHDVLLSFTPAGKAIADAQLASSEASVPQEADYDVPRTVGQRAAANWVSKRIGDRLSPQLVNAGWTPPPVAPGIWRPTPGAPAAAVQAYQGRGEPFLISALTARFVAPEPPAIDSPEVIADLQEIDRYGSLGSQERGPERTQIAKFWSQTSVAGFQNILREALLWDTSGLANQVRIVKEFHEITGDAQIAIYASKYKYLRWRPVTALTVDDGNPATPFDPKFVPLITTPQHPEYPSGHVGYAAAAELALRTLIGRTPIKPIRAQSAATPGVFTAYTEWSEITDDNVNARVWSGIHLRSTDNISRHFGYRIARAGLKIAAKRDAAAAKARAEALADR